MSDKFAPLMETVARKYLGDPNAHLSTPGKELRFGRQGSMSIDLVKGTFFNHEAGTGGGVAELIAQLAPGGNVVDILEKDFGLPKEQRQALLTLPQTPRVSSVIEYDYFDQDGVLRYQAIRRTMSDGTKQFRQSRPGPDGKPVYDLKGVEPLPYNLPRLLKTSGALFIVEGEKCVEAMTQAGLLATTNSGGAKNWKPELNQWFQGRSVVIIPDNDAPGEAHARHVAEQLQGVADEIRILRLPNLPPKGDVADWLVLGGDRKRLVELASAAEPWTPEQAQVEQPAAPGDGKLFELIAFDDLPEVKIKWLVKDLLPAQGFHNLFGQSGTYKSFVALYLSTMIASGQPAFGKDVTQGAVVYVAGEGKAGLKARRDAIAKQYKLMPGTPIFFLSDQIDLRSTPADAEKLVATIEAAGIHPTLLVIDTLNRAFSGGNENNSDDMGNFIRLTGWIQNRLNAAVMIVHHSGKDESKGARGHSSLRAALDAEIEVTRLSELGDDDRRGSMTVTKQKDGEDGQTFNYELLEIETKPGSVVTGSDAVSSLVVVPSEAQEARGGAAGGKKTRLPDAAVIALKALTKAIEEAGEVVHSEQIPRGTRCVKIALFKQYHRQMTGLDEAKMDRKDADKARKERDRALQKLQGCGQVGIWDPFVWVQAKSIG